MTDQPRIHIGGNVPGQVALGNFVYQVQAPGGTVNQIIVDEPIKIRPRPIDQRPSPTQAPLGREESLGLIADEWQGRAVQVHAGNGWGKTTILKHVARSPMVEKSADGVAVISAWGRPIEDLEQDLFDAFFESALPQMSLKATPGQIRSAMAGVEAVVMIDDLELDRRQVERLLDEAPSCRFFLTSDHMTLLDGGSFQLTGLDSESSVQLFTTRLGRLIDRDESDAVASYSVSCQGQPLALALAASAVRRGAVEIGELVGGVATVVNALGASLDLSERRALGVLQSVRGAPLPADVVGKVGSIDTPETVLERLRNDGLVLASSPRYRLPVEVGPILGLADLRAETLNGMTLWARSASEPSLLAEVSAALIELATWGKKHAPGATVDLARAAHAGLFLDGAWGAWSELLRAAQDAASSPFDRAWVLHELGTRDLLGGDKTGAVERLREALSIRNEIGDHEGGSVTRHNLDLLELGPRDPSPDNGGRNWLGWTLAILVGLVVVLAALYASGVIDPDGSDTTVDDTLDDTVESGTLEAGVERVDLGEIVVGSESTALWTVVNPGPGSVDIIGVSVDPPFDVDYDCETVAPLAECEMVIVFAPDQAGGFDSSLQVEHTGDDPPLGITVTGSGIDPPLSAFLEAAPGTLDLGAVGIGDVGRQVVEVRNAGEAPVDSIEAFLDSGDFFGYDTNCGSLDPGDSCEVIVFFEDATEPGLQEDTLIIEHSADNDTITIPVSVTVIAPPDVVGQILDWGQVDGISSNGFFEYWAVPLTVEILNQGGEPVQDPFRIHVEDVQGDGPVLLPSGPSEAELSGVTVSSILGPGDATEMTFFVAFDAATYDVGQVVPIRVVVDSCLGEEFIDDPPCRVAEGDNEANNVSEPVDLVIEGNVVE